MRLLIICLLFCSTAFAANIDCFLGKHHIYHGQSDSFMIRKDMIVISYKDRDEAIFADTKYAPVCIIRSKLQAVK
jgi:hypothetical protein